MPFFLLAGGLILVLITLLIRGILRDVRYGRRCAAYYGCLMRTVIPVVALALILANICSRPYLRHAERRWLAQDTVTGVDPDGGFTTVESRLVQRLKAEMQQAAGQKR